MDQPATQAAPGGATTAGLPSETVGADEQADSGRARQAPGTGQDAPASGPSGAEEAIVMESVIIEDEDPVTSGGAYPDPEGGGGSSAADADADGAHADAGGAREDAGGGYAGGAYSGGGGAGPGSGTQQQAGQGQGAGTDQIQERWVVIQSTFVDDPRGACGAAAQLASEAIAMLVASAQERERRLRGEWDRDGADTEALRNALRGYRSFLDRLSAL